MRSIVRHWFLAVLLFALSSGYLWANELAFLADIDWLKWFVVALTMFVMTWPLAFNSLVAAAKKPLAPMIASTLNLLVTPLIAWPLSLILGNELGPGLIVAAAVPSTLTSAAVWTRRAGGNDRIAIMVTIITNALCFVVTPAWVFCLTGVELDGSELVKTIGNLFLFVVVPMAIGQVARIDRRSADWATKNKSLLSTLAQIGILFMVLLGSINMGLRMNGQNTATVGPNLIAVTIVVVTGLHLFILFLGIRIGKWTGHSDVDQIAIGFSASQKTLMVGLSAAMSMGLNIIPIVAYHALQLIVDTLIADRFKIRIKKLSD